jgi:sodium/potassium/calcium exchanger 6
MFDSPVTPYAGGHYHIPRRQSRSSSISPRPLPESDEWDGALGVPLNDRSPKLFRASLSEEPIREEGLLVDVHEEGARTPLSIPTIPSILHTPASPTEAPALPVTEVEEHAPPTRPQRLWHVLARTWHILFPSFHHFGSKTLTGKIVSLLAAPAVMALTVTLPVVITPYGDDGSREDKHETRLPEFEEEGVERALIAEHEVQEDLHEVGFNKWLTAVQCILGPLFCVTVLFSASSSSCDARVVDSVKVGVVT